MSQSSLQTECPKCQTRFRVTEEQLGIAKGKVRCGNCMAVFNAIEHQVIPSSPRARSVPAADPTPGGHGADDDFVFADNPEEDAAEGPYAGSKLTFSDDELSDSFRSMGGDSQPEFRDTEVERPDRDIDESWAEAILQDTKRSDASALPSEPASPEPDPSSVTAEPEPEPEPAPEPAPDLELTPTSATDRSTATEATDDQLYESFSSDTRYDFDHQDDQPGEPMAATLPFEDLRREPVSVDDGGSGRWRTLAWTLVVLTLVGVLVAQVTWLQFDRLSAIPELRPFYEQGCELAGCELKPLVNVDAIQSRKLVVRTDPENRSQLVVDAVIINRADFEQPFPAIALTFSNLNGDVVAQSVFTPDEYLAGDGRELTAMPKGTPVRIAIDIRDPGKDAVNYNLNFRPYTP
ncbi:MAG: DUF3426 domain-containing protein [Pseudomonadota bacterium]|nr:DUF3426 domain-containing protein [Pseudomonadota bacterium]